MLSKVAKLNIAKLYALLSLRSFLIILPILTLYFMDHGLSIQQVFWLQVIFAIIIIFTEVPSGHIADKFGRKSALVLGALFGFLGYSAYWLAGDFAEFLIAEVLLGFSASFLSGADSALLYDTLLEEGVEKQYVKYEGRFLSSRTFIEAVAALLSSALLLFMEFKELFLLQAFAMFFLIPIALSIREPKKHAHPVSQSMRTILKYAVHENPRLRYLNIFGAILYGSTLCIVWFAQPLWESIGAPVVYFGIIWAIANMLVAISSFFAHKVDEYFSFKTLFAFLAAMPLLMYLLIAVATTYQAYLPYYIIVAVTMLSWIFRGFYMPIIKDYINRETDSSTRATVLSIQSLFNHIIFSAISPFLGWIADMWSFQIAFYASALIFGIPALIFFGLLYVQMSNQQIRQLA